MAEEEMMVTKGQERKALEQIKKIVAGLGEDSYIATALDGCLELAAQNIDLDAAFSMKGRWEISEREREAAIQKIKDMDERLAKAGKEAAAKIAELEAEVEDLKEQRKQLREDKFEAQKEAIEERKDITIETTDGKSECKPFAKVEFFNNNGFRFINVVEKSGWTNSYKVEDLKVLRVE